MRLSTLTAAVGLPIVALAVLSVPATAQRAAPNSATASMRVVAVVLPLLEFTTVAVTEAASRSTESIVISTVGVRANVPHRVLVRLTAPEQPATRAEVRNQDGQWVAVSSDRWIAVARSTATGETTYRVACRSVRDREPGARSGEWCALAYELRSPDVPSPISMTTTPVIPTGVSPGFAKMVLVSPTT